MADDTTAAEKAVQVERNDLARRWFARMKDTNQHGLFRLEQMPYDVMRLPLDEDLMWKWVSYGSFTVGWFIWQGTWGTTGS